MATTVTGRVRPKATGAGDPSGVRWFALAQASPRLAALTLFAVLAQVLGQDDLGTFAFAVAVGAAGQILGSAAVARPLAAVPAGTERARRQQGALSGMFFAAVLLLSAGVVAAALVGGPTGFLVLASSLAGAGLLLLETAYWVSVHRWGPRRAVMLLLGAHGLQVLATLIGWMGGVPDRALIVLPLVVTVALGGWMALTLGPSVGAAIRWFGCDRPVWLPYAVGSSATIGLVQVLPVVLLVTIGLGANSTFRAVELAFGLSGALIGVVTHTYLVRAGDASVGRLVVRGASVLVVTGVVNGIALAVLPTAILRRVFGPAADGLDGLIAVVSLQRCLLGIATVLGVLLLRYVSARTSGLLTGLNALVKVALVVVGAVSGGLEGVFVGLAVSEVLATCVYAVLLRRALRRHG